MVILPGVFLSLWCDNYDDAEGSPPSGASVAPHTCIRSVAEDRNHDAVMRIGGEAPRRWAHSKPRLEGQSVDDPCALPDEALTFPAGSSRILVLGRGNRGHAAMLRFAPQPAEKGSLEEFRVEPICLRPPVLSRHGYARRVDHIGLDLSGAQPTCQPEAVATGLIGDSDPLDRASGLNGLLPPTMQKMQ